MTLSVIVGPTAAGKSALALMLAERRGLAVLSADSRQVYRGFDIGTAKPSWGERARVRHFAIDVAEPGERFSAQRWVECANAALASFTSAQAPLVVVGGTGFYIRGLTHGLSAMPALDDGRRRALSQYLDSLEPSIIARWARRLDPPRGMLGNAQHRRAIEVALLSGRSLTDWIADDPPPPPRAARYLVIDPGDALVERIASRVIAMFDAGWADEVQGLLTRVPAAAPAWDASGYGQMRRFVDGEISREEAVARITIETRQYAKRQRTWFRHQLGPESVTRIDPLDGDAESRVLAWWDEGNEDPL